MVPANDPGRTTDKPLGSTRAKPMLLGARRHRRAPSTRSDYRPYAERELPGPALVPRPGRSPRVLATQGDGVALAGRVSGAVRQAQVEADLDAVSGRLIRPPREPADDGREVGAQVSGPIRRVDENLVIEALAGSAGPATPASDQPVAAVRRAPAIRPLREWCQSSWLSASAVPTTSTAELPRERVALALLGARECCPPRCPSLQRGPSSTCGLELR